jgi:beta-lactamase regulating signal transducer with metallopeptidase domain
LALFYALYHFWLRQETFFQFNRAYLLLMPAVSLAIPMLRIEHSAAPSTGAVEVLLPAVREVQLAKVYFYGQLEVPTPAFALTLSDIMLGIYLAGALFMLFKLTVRLLALWRLIRRSRRERKTHYTLLTPDQDLPASSFFSYVFWKGDGLPEAKRIILEHELVHVRQRHSIDVLLMECYLILKWFNPLVYAYRTALQQVHEYIADAYVSRQLGSRHTYAKFLALQKIGQSCHPLANTFAAHLRSRLQMLAQRSSSPWRAAKYLSVLPLMAALLLLFSFNLAEQLPGGGLKSAGKAVDDFAKQEIYADWGEMPDRPADGLSWGQYRLPVFAPAQLSGTTNELKATFLSNAAWQALRAERFELVLGDRVLWRKNTRAYLYRGSDLVREFPVKGKLKDYWTMANSGKTEDQVLVLVMEDAWGRQSCSVIGLGQAYSDELRIAMMEAAAYTIMKVVDRPKVEAASLCVALHEQNIQMLNMEYPWESSPYRLEVGQEVLGVQWYNNPFSGSQGPVLQHVNPEVLASVHNAPLRITNRGQDLAIEQLCVGLTTKDGHTMVLKAASPQEVQETWQQALKRLGVGNQLHLIARTEGQKAFFTSLGIGVSPHPMIALQHGDFKACYRSFSQRSVDPLPKPKAWLRRSGTEVRWGAYDWVLRQREGRASEATRYLPANVLFDLATADWSATYQEKPVVSDQLMLWSFSQSDAEVKPVPLFSEKGQRRLKEAAQRSGAFEIQVTFSVKNDADRGRLILKLNQERLIADGAAALRLKPNLDPFQFIYRPGAPTLIRMDTSVQQYRWMYEQYSQDPNVNVVPIPGFRTVERLRQEANMIVSEPEIGRVDLMDADYINTDTIPEYYELYNKTLSFHWRGLSGTRSDEVQPLHTFQNTTETGMLLEIGDLEYPVLQFELVIVPEDEKGVIVKSKSIDNAAVQDHLASLGPNTSLFLTDMVIQDTDGQSRRLPVTFSFNLK